MKPKLESTPQALQQYADECRMYCDKAKQILQEQEDPSSIAFMAREVIRYGRFLGQFEHMLSAAYSVTRDMANCLFDHPRLLLELLEVELEILEYVEAVQAHELGITEDLRDRIAQLKSNIKAADEKRWSDIRTDSMLKQDPVEWTAEYEAVIDEAEREAYTHLTDAPRGMGFCFAYWAEKQKALAKRGIRWRTPSSMNPGVMFD